MLVLVVPFSGGNDQCVITNSSMLSQKIISLGFIELICLLRFGKFSTKQIMVIIHYSLQIDRLTCHIYMYVYI